MKNKVIAAVFSISLIGLFWYALVNHIILEVMSTLLLGIAISTVFYVIYKSTLEWLDHRDATNKATKANEAYFDKIRNTKSKPPRK